MDVNVDLPVTQTGDARALREQAELEILLLLRRLCAATGMDCERVQVHTIAVPAADGERPQVIPCSVKIVLAV